MRTLIEEAVADHSWKSAVGNVRNLDDLMKPASLAALESVHSGVFAFLAFHPQADRAVVAYLKGNSLASDSGPNILTFFTLEQQSTKPSVVTDRALAAWLDLDSTLYPSYQLIRILFLPKPVPRLPGIVFFTSFTENREAVYVHLGDSSDETAVRDQARAIFSLADQSFRDSRSAAPREFANNLASHLQRGGHEYERASATSMGEWLYKGFQLVNELRGDIVSVVGLFK